MKILVTGAAGFIGSHVVDTYLAHGHEVVAVDDLSTGRLSNLNPAARFYEVDIRSPELERVFEAEKPDVVNHHAAQMDVRRSVTAPLFDADVNILGSINLLENAARHNVKRIIYISSGGAVYGEPEYLPCDEDHPARPISQYGASKYTIEHYLFLYQHIYGLNYVVLRYANVYGPRQNPHGEAGVVAIFTGQMLANQQITINGDGEQQRDFIYVGDCAQANLLALTNEKVNTIHNIGSGLGSSVNDIYRMLKDIARYDKSPQYAPARLGEARRIYLDTGRAARQLGWVPAVNLMDGLKITVDYFQKAEFA